MGFVAAAQDTLPSFTLVNKGNNRIIISWSNPFGQDIRQLSIQRSFDSAKNFKSILTLPDPTVPQNGYVDTKATNEHMFYRLYILLDSGKYVFSKAKKPEIDTLRVKEVPKEIKKTPLPPPVVEIPKPDTVVAAPVKVEPKPKEPAKKEVKIKEPVKPKELPERIFYIKKRDSLAGQVSEKSFKRFRDSVATRTKDTLSFTGGDTIFIKPFVLKEIPERILFIKRRDTLAGQLGEKSFKHFRDSVTARTKDTLSFTSGDTIFIKPFVPKEVYKTSVYVFTEKDGNVRIALPLAGEKKYTIKFFDEYDAPALEIKQIKDTLLTLDKSNFIHAGWFKFELYEDGRLKEKNKLYIPRDF
jgi:hypothetical protein